MAKIYKKTDKIPIKIDDITVTISPLSLAQKNEAIRLIAEGTVAKHAMTIQEGVLLLMKYAIKGISGVQYADNSEYSLSFTDQGCLTDDCIDELLNLSIHQKLLLTCSNLTRGIPTEFVDQAGNKIEGVEIIQTAPKEQTDPN